MEPRHVGPFRLGRLLGRGGAGSVHEAVHSETGGTYALKLLLPEGMGNIDPQHLTRFRRECEALAKLDHPHVVRIHSADLEGPFPYLVQDLLTGGSLEDRLRGGALPLDQSISVTLAVADAIGAAHAAGILHRDLKPENVLFDERGVVKVVDFGLARELEGGQDLTKTGVVLGTPTCMAPEQARGARDVDQRTDVYGLGAVLYACLTGSPPTPPQPSVLMTLAAVERGKVAPPSSVQADVPPAIEAVAMRALAKDRAERFEDPPAFSEALKRAALNPHASSSSHRPWVLIGVAALSVGLLGLGIASSGADPTPPPAHGVAPAPDPRPSAHDVAGALSRGDGEEALRLLDDLGAPAEDARRGQAAFLTGDLDLAEPLLRDPSSARILSLERRRLELQASLAKLDRRFGGADPHRKTLAETSDLVRACARLVDVPVLGRPLARRVQFSAGRASLSFGHLIRIKVSAELDALLEEARRLGAGPGQTAIELAAIHLLHESRREKPKAQQAAIDQEVLARLQALESDQDLPPDFASMEWALRAKLTWGGKDGVLYDSPPPLPPPRDMVYEQREALADTFRIAEAGIARHLRDAIRTERRRKASKAWRAAVRYRKLILQYAHVDSSEGFKSRLRLATLYLAVSRPEDVRPLFADVELCPPKYTLCVTYLLLEADLALGRDLPNGEVRLGALLKEYPESRVLRCLRSAFRFRRGSLLEAQTDLGQAEHMPGEDQLQEAPSAGRAERERIEVCARLGQYHLGWRTPEGTRVEELENNKGVRWFLTQALRDHPE